MQKFVTHRGIAAPLLRVNIDTDAIIPSREMKRVSREGLGDSLFAGWRYRQGTVKPGDLDPEFVLNQPAYANASILLTGQNMGCGSSREFAVWALKDFGIRAIISPSFGAIFYTNCIRNGLLPIILDEKQISEITAEVTLNPQSNALNIDLQHNLITTANQHQYSFKIASSYQQMLLHGLDPIDLTLQLQTNIDEFIKADQVKRPWAHSIRLIND
jgi:3-isopropylmalate/(R)-2-methylmalate dehydratase small subunit